MTAEEHAHVQELEATIKRYRSSTARIREHVRAIERCGHLGCHDCIDHLRKALHGDGKVRQEDAKARRLADLDKGIEEDLLPNG